MESELLFSGNSILLFAAFLSLCENRYKLKSPFPLAGMKDFLNTLLPLDWKKLSLNREKNAFH